MKTRCNTISRETAATLTRLTRIRLGLDTGYMPEGYQRHHQGYQLPTGKMVVLQTF